MFNHIYQSKPEFLWVKQSVLNRQKMQKEKLLRLEAMLIQQQIPTLKIQTDFLGKGT